MQKKTSNSGAIQAVVDSRVWELTNEDKEFLKSCNIKAC